MITIDQILLLKQNRWKIRERKIGWDEISFRHLLMDINLIPIIEQLCKKQKKISHVIPSQFPHL